MASTATTIVSASSFAAGFSQTYGQLLALRGIVVDYGTQDVPLKEYSLRSAIRIAIHTVLDSLKAGYLRGNARIPIAQVFCDSGHEPDAVFDAVQNAPVPLMPILGRGETQMDKRRYNSPSKKSAIIREIDPDGRWHVAKVKRANVYQLTLDADHAKRWVDSSMRLPIGADGSLSLFAGPESTHRRFIRHQLNEQWIVEELPGEAPKGRWARTGANHFKDALAYSAVAAWRVASTSAKAAGKNADSEWSY